jgi:hypothetical protein
MKRTIKLLALAAVVAVFAVPALAQTKECNDEFKSATYSKWYDNRTKDQAAAYEAAKEYLAVCTTDDQYSAALKKFKAAYEAATADVTNRNQFNDAVKNKNYPEQMKLGKALLAAEPDNPAVIIVLGLAGLGDANLLSESATYAKKAIEMIEAGKPFAPLASKDEALAYLNYVMGKASLQNSPSEALPYLIKAARYESNLKKDTRTYVDILTAYEKGPRAKLTADYEAKYKGQPESPESKLAAANIDQIIDREIDVYARLAALTTAAADKKTVMDELTELYKYRNKSEAGLDAMLAGILNKPLPDVPTPLTSVPTSSTPTAPANSGSQSGGGTTTTTGAGNGTGTAKPAASPTPTKKPRTNYRRG